MSRPPLALALTGLVLLAGCTAGPPPTATVEIVADPVAGRAYRTAVLQVAPGMGGHGSTTRGSAR